MTSECVCNFMNQIAVSFKNASGSLEVLSFLFNTCEANDIAKKNIVEPFVEILKRVSNLKKLFLSFGLNFFFFMNFEVLHIVS